MKTGQAIEIRRLIRKLEDAVRRFDEDEIARLEDRIIGWGIDLASDAANSVHAFIESEQHDGASFLDHRVIKVYVSDKLIPDIKKVPEVAKGKF